MLPWERINGVETSAFLRILNRHRVNSQNCELSNSDYTNLILRFKVTFSAEVLPEVKFIWQSCVDCTTYNTSERYRDLNRIIRQNYVFTAVCSLH